MPVLEIIERTTIREIEAPLPTCTPADPFHLDHDCLNPTGHDFIGDCSEVVCLHCARIAWQ